MFGGIATASRAWWTRSQSSGAVKASDILGGGVTGFADVIVGALLSGGGGGVAFINE